VSKSQNKRENEETSVVHKELALFIAGPRTLDEKLLAGNPIFGDERSCFAGRQYLRNHHVRAFVMRPAGIVWDITTVPTYQVNSGFPNIRCAT